MDSENFDEYDEQLEKSAELNRKAVINKIVEESPGLVDELLNIAYNNERDDEGRAIVDIRSKLTAIGMLLDRGVPKLAVDGSKSEVVEESKTRRKIREEIEAMAKGKKIVE